MVDDGVEALEVGIGPSRLGISVEGLGEELLQHLVHEGAAVAGRDPLLVHRVLVGPDPEDVAQQVLERAQREPLEAGGRGQGLVVHAQLVPDTDVARPLPVRAVPPVGDRLQASGEAGVGRHDGMVVQLRGPRHGRRQYGGQVPLPRVEGHGHPPHRLLEGPRPLQPADLEVGDVADADGPTGAIGELFEQPAGGLELTLTTGVAARGHEDHLGPGGARGQVVTPLVGPIGSAEGIGQAGVTELVIRQQRVVPVPRRVPTLGHADHDDQVEVEPVHALEVADLHAPAEAAHPPG